MKCIDRPYFWSGGFSLSRAEKRNPNVDLHRHSLRDRLKPPLHKQGVSIFATFLLLTAPFTLAAEPDHPKLSYEKWTADFAVPDPVALDFDNQGRAYVISTQRRKANDLDIRRNQDWVEDDVALETVAAKQKLFRERLSPANSAANVRRVKDYNNDGSHDWKDLTALTEKIFLIEDSDGDGRADKKRLFADGFNSEVTGIGAGVLHHNGDVYATVAPDVWKISAADAEKREVIAHGFGVHIAYAGHDMHGLTVGPDGRIYWSIGDKGISVTTKDGKRFHYPNQGGVMRCNPDGSNFEVFAHGLRNVQELAFDEFGNLFGVDNDADQKGEMERFIYIVEGMDAGWRCNYQYRGKAYNPWMAERLWEPENDAQPAYLLPPIQNYHNGPAGFVYNPGTALGPNYQGYFFLSQFPSNRQSAFRVEPDGASFKMVDEHQIGAGPALIGMNFAPDGALYGVDWGGGYPLNQQGAVWRIDLPGAADSASRQETAGLLRDGMTNRTKPTLRTLLGHADQRVRLAAQFELVHRKASQELCNAARDGNAPLLACVHAVWGIGQLMRSGGRDSIEPSVATSLTEAATGPPNLAIQIARVLRNSQIKGDVAMLRTFIRHEDPRLRFHGAIAAGKRGLSELLPDVVAQLESGKADSPYLRHAFQQALAGCGKAKQLAALTNKTVAVRLAAVVALRERLAPQVAVFVNDPDPRIAAEAARAIHDDFSINDAMPALAEALGRQATDAFTLRAINANFRLGTSEAAKRVAAFSADSAHPAAMRAEALNALLSWQQPPRLDRVTGRARPGLKSRATVEINAVIKPYVDQLVADPSDLVRKATFALISRLKLDVSPAALRTVVLDNEAAADLRTQALDALINVTPKALNDVQEKLLTDPNPMIRAAVLKSAIANQAPKLFPLLQSRLHDTSSAVVEKQVALAGLATLPEADAQAELMRWHNRLTSGKLPAALILDVRQALTARGIELKHVQNPKQRYAPYSAGGDPIRGQDLFMNHLAAACIRCHRVARGPGSTIGPSLMKAGNRPAHYLAQSIIDPGAVIARGFGLITVTRKNGTVVSGNLIKSDKRGITIQLPDLSRTFVPIADVATQTKPISTMPPMAGILTPFQIRDVVAYLQTLK